MFVDGSLTLLRCIVIFPNGRLWRHVRNIKDKDYQPLGSRPQRPRTVKKCPNVLSQMGISPEQIADTNYLAQLRLYRNLIDYMHEGPEESLEDFVRNADDVATHALKDGKYIHTCSAARGVMYISPSVWKKMVDDK